MYEYAETKSSFSQRDDPLWCSTLHTSSRYIGCQHHRLHEYIPPQFPTSFPIPKFTFTDLPFHLHMPFFFWFVCLEREFSCLKIVASIGIRGRGPRATCFMQPALPFSSGDILITSTVSLLRYMARMCVSKTTPSGDFHVSLGRLGENGLKIYCDNSSSTIFTHNSPSRKSNALLRFLDSLLANHQYFGGEGGGVEELHHENGNENNDLIKGNHAKLASLRPHKNNILITGTVITLTSFWPHNTLMTGNLIIITSFWPHKKTARNSLPYNGKSRHAVAFTKDGTKELHYNRTSHHIKLALTSQKTARGELPYNGTSHHTNITSDGTDLAPL